jgi:hypothetical protein
MEIVSRSSCRRGLAEASLEILQRTIIIVQEAFRKMNSAMQKPPADRL